MGFILLLVAVVIAIAALLAMIAAPVSLGCIIWWGADWALKPTQREASFRRIKLGSAGLAASICCILFSGWLLIWIMALVWPNVP